MEYVYISTYTSQDVVCNNGINKPGEKTICSVAQYM